MAAGPTFPMMNLSVLHDSCEEEGSSINCTMDPTEFSKRNALAAIRIVFSVLSIGGSLSIIMSVLIRGQVRSPKILPIFIISIADFLLALTWVIGGALWFSHLSQRVWCFLPSLLTVILVCITANLTVVYAIFSYFNLKHKDFQSILANIDRTEADSKLPLTKALVLYSVACCFPVFVILLSFGALEAKTHFVSDTNNCSCWCKPHFGNVVPITTGTTYATASYVDKIQNLLAVYGFVVGTNYLVTFVLLLFIYTKILRWIKHLRKQHQKYRRSHPHYGAVDVLIMRGQSQARKRIVYFLTVFIITGFANLFLSYTFAVLETKAVVRGVRVKHRPHPRDLLTGFPMFVYVVQSITVTSQGFLNALVYGWTRGDFIRQIRRQSSHSGVATLTSRSSEGDSGATGNGYQSSLLLSNERKRWSRSYTVSGKTVNSY